MENLNDIKQTFIESGLETFTETIGYFNLGEFAVIGGRAGMGKRNLLSTMAINMARSVPVAYFSLDLNPNQLMLHLISSISEIPLNKIFGQKLDPYEEVMFDNWKRMFPDKIHIEGGSNLGLEAFGEYCQELIQNKGLKVLLVDSLQMLKDVEASSEKRATMQSVCRLLKSIAREQNVCVIATTELSRSVDTQVGYSRMPAMSHLGERGVIEQLADKILFLYRPAYYGLTEDENGNPTENVALLLVAKNNFGAVGQIELFYDHDISKFKNMVSYGDETIEFW